MKKIVLAVLLSAVIFSCQDENVPVSVTNAELQLKKEFGKAISKAFVSDKNIRQFVRDQALKMMDGDYDIPYRLVKQEKLLNGSTFETVLSKYFESESDLKLIESTFPLLTIFVPTLPENSFSAATWDIENEIPYVALRLSDTNDIPIISPEGEEYLLDAELIPSYPVVVIKENERMVYQGQQGFELSKATRTLKSVDGLVYKFFDDAFDAELQKNNSENKHLVFASSVDTKLKNAYDIYLNADGWQRDYIYYGITPSSPNGQFSYDFVEHVRYFDIVGDDRVAYNKIADQSGDPKIKSGKKSSGWTDGYFEIRANVLVQAKNGIGSTIPNSFILSGASLFDVTYTVDRRGVWPFRYDYYIINTVTAIPQSINLPIVNWDLNNYAASLRIDVEEVDNTTVVTESVSETVKFATNFGIEGTVLKKIGLKFGASLENTVTHAVSRQYTLSSDQLGTVIVNFADDILISKGTILNIPYYIVRNYENGIFAISVEPKRVQ